MADCERLPTCSYFQRIMTNMPTTVVIFKRSYCQNDFTNCARHMLHAFLEERSFEVSDELEKKIGRLSSTLAPNDQEKVIELISS